MKKLSYNIFSIIVASSVLFLSSCGSGVDDIDPILTYGCTDSTALNYDSLATENDSSCVYDIEPLLIYGCTDSTALNYDSLATVDDGSCLTIIGEWQFNANCTEYPNPLTGGADTIFLDEELPDVITVLSSSSNNLFIEAGSNDLIASINSTGNFNIGFQSFRAYVDAFADTITIFIEGTGVFISDNEGVMDLTFSEPFLQVEINCSVNISR